MTILHLGLFVNVVRPSKIPAGKQLPGYFCTSSYWPAPLDLTTAFVL